MRYALVTPYEIRVGGNAGWHFITGGIKHLIREADPRAEFVYVDFFERAKWPTVETFKTFDWVVLCGNPRYDMSEKDDWLYAGLLIELKQIHDKTGVKILDAWQGSAVPLGYTPETDIAGVLARTDRNQKLIGLLRRTKAQVIARDITSQTINERNGIPSVMMPCSSFWGVLDILPRVPEKMPPRTLKTLIVYNMAGYEGAEAVVRTLARTHSVFATNRQDSDWADSIGVRHTMVYDPLSLVEIYLRSAEVISYRLHAAIPAASVGCKVHYAAVDSRFETCAPFGISTGDYRSGIAEPVRSAVPATPDLRPVLGIQ